MSGIHRMAGFISILAGIAVLLGKYVSPLGKFQLILIGGVVAILAGLISVAKRGY